MLLNLFLAIFILHLPPTLNLKRMINMDVITPNKLLYRDFNTYPYGTEIMNFLLLNKQEINTQTNEFTFCIIDVQTCFKKNIDHSRFYKTILSLKNNDVDINNSTFSIFSRVDNPYNGEITVEIHPSVIDYFGLLHKDFTKYHLYSLICLSSPTAKKIYLLLSHFIKTGRVVNNQEAYYRIKIDQLRNYLFVSDLYRGYHNFHNVLIKHLEEVNKVTDFSVTATPEKKGKKYNSYNLYIKQNPIVKEKINECFKEEKQLVETIDVVSRLKVELKQAAPERTVAIYWLNNFELDMFRTKLLRVPQLRIGRIEEIVIKLKAHGFSSMKNYERWLLLLDDIASKKSTIKNAAGYVVGSLLKNNG